MISPNKKSRSIASQLLFTLCTYSPPSQHHQDGCSGSIYPDFQLVWKYHVFGGLDSCEQTNCGRRQIQIYDRIDRDSFQFFLRSHLHFVGVGMFEVQGCQQLYEFDAYCSRGSIFYCFYEFQSCHQFSRFLSNIQIVLHSCDIGAGKIVGKTTANVNNTHDPQFICDYLWNDVGRSQ